MGVPGEDLEGVYAAKDFVGWYNGLPSCREVRLNYPVSCISSGYQCKKSQVTSHDHQISRLLLTV